MTCESFPKGAPVLRKKAKDRYYVPDPSKELDVQKSREKGFFANSKSIANIQKKLRVFRLRGGTGRVSALMAAE